jgi:hypothetical protein
MKKNAYLFKHIPTLTFLIALIGITFYSCEDDDKNFLNDFTRDGGFVRFVDNNPPSAVGVNQVSDLTYSFAVEDANNNVSSYDLKLYADLAGTRTDTVDVEVVTSFPKSFTFSTSNLASLLGVNENDINFGDSFFFTATVTTNKGTVYSGANRLGLIKIFKQSDGTYLDEDDDPVDIGPTDEIVTDLEGNTFLRSGQGITDDILDEAGYRQAFEFDFVILCPSADFSLLAGNYDVETLGFSTFFGETDFTREIVLGPKENQITILDGEFPAVGSDDLILDIDPATGAISLAETGKDEPKPIAFSADAGAFDTDVYGSAEGYVFTCINPVKIVITMDFTTYAGNPHPFILVKQTDP